MSMKGEIMYGGEDDYYLAIPIQEGIVLRRGGNGKLFTNIERLAIHHSPNGFEMGYSGSGPSDLALNIVEAVLITAEYSGYRMTDTLFNGYQPFLQAWRLHQSFKQEFIAGLSSAPGEYRLDFETVKAWIYDHMIPEPAPETNDEEDQT